MSDDKKNLSQEDFDLLMKSLGKPVPASVRSKVFEKVREIDREMQAGRITPPVKLPEIEREPKRDEPEGRDDV